jgi:hypothetical protein
LHGVSTFQLDTAWIVPKIQEISRWRYFDCNDVNPIRTLLLTTHHKIILRRANEPALLGGRNRFGGGPHPASPPRLDLYKDELSFPLAHDIQLTATTAPVPRYNPVTLLLQPDCSQMLATGAEPLACAGIWAGGPGRRL